MSPLSKEEQHCLLDLAREAIAAALALRPLHLEAASARLPTDRLRQPSGAFVSLHRAGRLRGCVGYPAPRKPLYETVAEGALAAAFHDPRFEPLTAEELPAVEIEISLLSPLFPIHPDEVEPGTHGLLVTQGLQRGLLLPQVAREHGWSREEFLEETCAKAGLDREAWKKGTVKLEAFTAFVFSEARAREAEPSPR